MGLYILTGTKNGDHLSFIGMILLTMCVYVLQTSS